MAALLAGWILATPPGAGFDEQAHLVRALAAADGQWSGAPQPQQGSDDLGAALVRRFSLAGRFDPEATARCAQLDDRRTYVPCIDAALTERPGGRVIYPSYVGLYDPVPYLPAGLAAQAVPGPVAGFLAARAATALVCIALLASALVVAGGPRLRVGLLAAATPSVLYLCATVGTNGLEVCAALLLGVGVLRLCGSQDWRGGSPRGDPPTRVWAAIGVGGAVLAVARPLGPLFVLLWVLLAVVLLGPRGLRRQLARRSKAMAVALSAVVVAVAGAALWALAVALPAVAPSLSSRLDGTSADSTGGSGLDLTLLPRLLAQAFGAFAWGQDRRLPLAGFAVIGLPILIVVAVGLLVSRGRLRAVLLGVAVFGAMLGVAFDRLLGGPLGYAGPQARYLLAFWVAAPLVAAAILPGQRWDRARLNATGTGRRSQLERLLLAAGLLTAVGQGVALAAQSWFYRARPFEQIAGLPGAVVDADASRANFLPGDPYGGVPVLLLLIVGVGLLAWGLVLDRRGPIPAHP